MPAGPRRPLPDAAGHGRARALLDRGYRYAFCSNADNLGATADPRIAGVDGRASDIPFVMEVVRRTPADRKGGHLARRRSRRPAGPARDRADRRRGHSRRFQDIDRHRYFNTNNMWIDLAALAALLDATTASSSCR